MSESPAQIPSIFKSSINDDLDRSYEYQRLMIPQMRHYQIPVTPLNYQLWYEHVSGRNMGLSQDLTKLLEDPSTRFDEVGLGGLYAKHIATPEVGLLEARRKDLEKIVDSTLSQIGTANSTAGDVNERFKSHSDSLSSMTDPAEIAELVMKLMNDSKSMVDSSEALKSQLTETNSEIAQLKEELIKAKQVASTDALTGLTNRGAFDELLLEQIEDSEQATEPSVLAIIDIDHFKSFNDEYGHLIGDNVLRFVAKHLDSMVGETNHAARFGGEEFALIFPHTSVENAANIVDEIRCKIETSRLRKKNSQEKLRAITFSAGLTKIANTDSIEAAVERADQALYKSKAQGRNQITISDDMPVAASGF